MSYFGLDRDFFGREDILSLLKKRIVDLKEGYRQNVAIMGPQYVGKSSILHQFIANLDDPNITIVYLDLENKDFDYFINKISSAIVYNFLRNKNVPLHEDLSLLLESGQKFIPQTIQVIKRIRKNYLEGKQYEAFLGLISLPEIFTNESGQFCVMIIDEFQVLESFDLPHVFQDLGKKIMTQKKCLYFMSSSFPGSAKKILAEKLSLLFGNFESVYVEPFDLKVSQRFIEYNLRDVKIGVQLQNFLTDFSGGYPLYVNLICQEMLNLAALHRQPEIYFPLLSQAVENTIFNRWGVISRHFELIVNTICSGKDNRVTSTLLMAISDGKLKLEELLIETKMSKLQLQQRLNHLIEMGIVIKNGNIHYFKDKLFRYWIKFVYQKRLKDIELSPDRQRRQFKEEFLSAVESYKFNSNKDFSLRVVELFHCFDNEAFQLNGKKYKLPQFQNIAPSRIEHNGVYFDAYEAATTDSSVWFLALKKDHFAERDVNLVLTAAKKCSQKPERCVIISLSHIDENAKLKALQEHFWIWNEHELSMLFSLFNKPFISS